MTQWYYEDAGQTRGPIAETDLATMLADGMLPAETRLWHESFGQEWRPANQTKFTTRASTAGPPPLQPTVSSPPPIARPADAGQPTSPPPISAAAHAASAPTALNTRYAILIALVPIIIMALEALVLVLGVSPSDSGFKSGGTIWTFILSFWFAHKDAKAIAAAGLNPQRRTMVPFLFLTQIGYFLRRRSVAGLSLKPLWIWLAASVVYLVWILAVHDLDSY